MDISNAKGTMTAWSLHRVSWSIFFRNLIMLLLKSDTFPTQKKYKNYWNVFFFFSSKELKNHLEPKTFKDFINSALLYMLGNFFFSKIYVLSSLQ